MHTTLRTGGAIAPRGIRLAWRLALVVGGVAGISACSSTNDRAARASDETLSPEVKVVDRAAVMSAATVAADQRPGGFVVVVDDDDMLPMYPRGTALVIELADFHSLREGMTVLFRGSEGGRRAHVLAMKKPDGWVTRGLNAKDDDPQLMTETVYLGKVAAAYSSTLSATASN